VSGTCDKIRIRNSNLNDRPDGIESNQREKELSVV
jgi:hypothetical protein